YWRGASARNWALTCNGRFLQSDCGKRFIVSSRVCTAPPPGARHENTVSRMDRSGHASRGNPSFSHASGIADGSRSAGLHSAGGLGGPTLRVFVIESTAKGAGGLIFLSGSVYQGLHH